MVLYRLIPCLMRQGSIATPKSRVWDNCSFVIFNLKKNRYFKLCECEYDHACARARACLCEEEEMECLI